MKRQFISLEHIAAHQNLLEAFQKAARGKRYRRDVQAFVDNFNHNIYSLSQAILAAQLPYGRFREFTIYDPKQRTIHAACFEDRVFHHAVMNIAGASLERAMSPFSYACRPDKGVHKAVQQVQNNVRRFAYYGKIDIANYFAVIDHRVLMQVLQRRYKGQAFLQQLQRIIASHQVQTQQGLPIGSLTSQYFANYYLDGLDKYLEQQPNIQAYVRYMDDIIWWCADKQTTQQSLQQLKMWLWQQRKLCIKPHYQIQSSRHGVSYCGFHISQGAIRLSRRKKQRFQHRLHYWEQQYQQGHINAQQLQQAYAAVHAITAHTHSLGWRRKNLKHYPALEV